MKDKTKWFYIGFVSDILCLIAVVYGLMSKGFPGNLFPEGIIIAVVVGIVLHLVGMFLNYHWLPLLPTICYGFAFALILQYGLPTITDKYWGIYYSGGKFEAVMTYLILTGIAMLLALVLLFFKQSREPLSR